MNDLPQTDIEVNFKKSVDLEGSFAKLLGRQPTDTERQNLYRVKEALELKNNDALWLVLMALEHYQGQYEEFPDKIAKSAEDILGNIKETADATMKASAESAKADLAEAVNTVAQKVAYTTSVRAMFQWIAASFAVVCLACVTLGLLAYKGGFDILPRLKAGDSCDIQAGA